jgi:glycosyltransferase involved in cell wall biosynthesis
MFGNRNFDVIKNGIELKKYEFNEIYRNECRAELDFKNSKIIGCIGRLDPEKNLSFSIDVFKHLLNKEPNSTLIFIGDGELKAELQNEVISKGLSEKIKFLGARNDVYKWLSAIDCLLMPSFFEGLPFVLVEAQASGLPCLVSSTVSSDANITGLVEYMDLETDKQQWADKLIELSKKERVDTTDMLISSGYAIESTAAFVSKIIDTAFGE